MIDPTPDTVKTWQRLASRRLLDFSIQHNGTTRAALLYVPQHVRRRGGLPLVLVFHGGASGPTVIAKLSAMHRIAEREGFIVAYPTGTMGRSGLTWVPGGRESARATGDTLFVRKLITELTRHYEVDPTRIFAAGISIGGSLVYELACRAAGSLAAIAVVGGTMTADHGVPANPVPLLHIHGMLDRRVPFKGGRGPATTGTKEWLPVAACIEQWREINACDGEPEIVRSAIAGVTGYKYRGVADIELWLVEGVGHSWPGSRRDLMPVDAPTPVTSFSASEKIWSFFAAHPRRRAAVPQADGSTVEAYL